MEELKVLPHDLKAEQAVIGAVLVGGNFQDVAFLHPEDFYIDAHKEIWRAIQKVIEKQEKADMIIVGNYLKEHGKLEEIGGYTYLAELESGVPNTANAPYYGKIVKKDALARKGFEISNRIIDATANADIEKAKELALNLLDLDLPTDVLPIYSKMDDIMQKIDKAPEGVQTGYEILDKVVNMYPSDVVLIKGMRKNGKTTFALNLLANLLKQDKQCMYLTLEMPAETVLAPMIASIALEKPALWKEDKKQRVAEFIAEYGDRLYLLPESDKPIPTFKNILNIIREIKKSQGLDFVFIDYDQLIPVKKEFQSEERRLSYIVSNFKLLADELGIIVVLLSQINKEGSARWSVEKENYASLSFMVEKETSDSIRVWVEFNRFGKSQDRDSGDILTVNWSTRRLRE
jgi:replicative DNA helicase